MKFMCVQERWAVLALALISSKPVILESQAQEPIRAAPSGFTTFAPIVEKIAPSVVTIFTTERITRKATSLPFSDDAMRQFFGVPMEPSQRGQQTIEGL